MHCPHDRDYRPARDVRQMLSGTQPIVSLSLAEIGIDIMLRADLQAIREKSMRMTDLFVALVEQRCGDQRDKEIGHRHGRQ